MKTNSQALPTARNEDGIESAPVVSAMSSVSTLLHRGLAERFTSTRVSGCQAAPCPERSSTGQQPAWRLRRSSCLFACSCMRLGSNQHGSPRARVLFDRSLRTKHRAGRHQVPRAHAGASLQSVAHSRSTPRVPFAESAQQQRRLPVRSTQRAQPDSPDRAHLPRLEPELPGCGRFACLRRCHGSLPRSRRGAARRTDPTRGGAQAQAPAEAEAEAEARPQSRQPDRFAPMRGAVEGRPLWPPRGRGVPLPARQPCVQPLLGRRSPRQRPSGAAAPRARSASRPCRRGIHGSASIRRAGRGLCRSPPAAVRGDPPAGRSAQPWPVAARAVGPAAAPAEPPRGSDAGRPRAGWGGVGGRSHRGRAPPPGRRGVELRPKVALTCSADVIRCETGNCHRHHPPLRGPARRRERSLGHGLRGRGPCGRICARRGQRGGRERGPAHVAGQVVRPRTSASREGKQQPGCVRRPAAPHGPPPVPPPPRKQSRPAAFAPCAAGSVISLSCPPPRRRDAAASEIGSTQDEAASARRPPRPAWWPRWSAASTR